MAEQTGLRLSIETVRKLLKAQEIAELLEALVTKHPTGTIYVAWDNATTHADEEVKAVVRAAVVRVPMGWPLRPWPA
jgi:putative transposase